MSALNVAEARAALGMSATAAPPVLTNGEGPKPALGVGVQQSMPPNVLNAAEPSKTQLPNGGKWARYAGKLGTALTVTLSGAAIRKGGHEPNEPDDADCKLLEDALEEGLRLQYGDKQIPWWMGAALAAGGVYAGMRVGAPKLRPNAEIEGQSEPTVSPNEISQVKPAAPPPPAPLTGIIPKRMTPTGR